MISNLRQHFNSFKTLDVNYRINLLKALRKSILDNENLIYSALYKDLHKCKQESFLTEISPVLDEINYFIKNLPSWSKAHKVKSGITVFPSKSYTLQQAYGVVLIIAPWNYPFQLLFMPLIAALGAGNCCLLKPSHLSVNVSAACLKIISSLNSKAVEIITEESYYSALKNDKQEITYNPKELMDKVLNCKYDYIFYTGGPNFGKEILKRASDNLCPVTLELGGKSPVIISKEANIDLCAKKIAWGKFLNCGQTCVAPDYIFIEEAVKDQLIEKLIAKTKEIYSNTQHYGKIISTNAYQRLQTLINSLESTALKGKCSDIELLIEPIISYLGKLELYKEHFYISSVNVKEFPIMQEEIFGPILPIISYTNIDNAINYINSKEKPLSLYVFASKKQADYIIKHTFSGSAAINDCIIQLSNRYLPFGGVGNSGMGNYHGKFGFYTFSHSKSYIKASNLDTPFRYPPFKYFKFLEKILK